MFELLSVTSDLNLGREQLKVLHVICQLEIVVSFLKGTKHVTSKQYILSSGIKVQKSNLLQFAHRLVQQNGAKSTNPNILFE